MIETIVLSVLLLAALVWERFERSRELRALLQAHSVERGELLGANVRERELWALERERLLQRIQAPVQAVIDHAIRDTPTIVMPPVLGMDDDEAHAAQAMSKEELAAAEWGAELAEATA